VIINRSDNGKLLFPEQEETWFIFDIDGTLCDISDRAHFARAKDWVNFHAGIPTASPRWAECNLARLIHQSSVLHKIALVSGRPIQYTEETQEWLDRHKVPCHELYMRTDLALSDCDLKEQIYVERFLERGREVAVVLEDRDSVVEMYRRNGQTCFQVQPGAY